MDPSILRALRNQIELHTGERQFVDGDKEEYCAACGKHIRHHYGGTEYRCDPRAIAAPSDPPALTPEKARELVEEGAQASAAYFERTQGVEGPPETEAAFWRKRAGKLEAAMRMVAAEKRDRDVEITRLQTALTHVISEQAQPRRYLCDREGCAAFVDFGFPIKAITAEAALGWLGWRVKFHEQDRSKDRHHCPRCAR